MKDITALLVLLACAGPVVAQETNWPDYYPDDYGDIVEASREEGMLLIYSNMAEYNWSPIIEGFNEQYPWIEVETLDLPSGTVHARWEAEVGSDVESADFMVSGANDRWVMHGVEGDMAEYQSPELTELEDFAQPQPGVYVLSTDPSVIVYNTLVLDEDSRPTGLRHLAALAEAEPGTFQGRMTTYDAARNAFGLAEWWFTLEAMGDEGWDALATLGPMMRMETSAGPMIEKIATGEYVAGIGLGGVTVFPRLSGAGADIMEYVFPDDGTPVMFRGMGIPGNADSPNSARLLLDYLLSNVGQTKIGNAGLTPYREDVDEEEVLYTYQEVVDLVGEENVIPVGFSREMVEDAEAFAQRWSEVTAQN